MFGNSSIIIFLTKGILHVTWAHGMSITKTIRHEWNTQSLPKLFTLIKSHVGNHPVRILLADEFSYILELTVPPHVLNERLYIEEQLKTYIPEVLHSNEWDYREVPSHTKEKKVLIFAPVKFIYGALLKASEVSGIHIEAIEPVQIAGRRHKNPVIGLSQKKDIKGKDESVLNVIPREFHEVQKEDDSEKTSSSLVWSIILLVVLLLGCGAVVAYSLLGKQKPVSTKNQPEPTPTTVLPEPSPSEEPTPTLTAELDKSSITFQVLNGTGLPGASSEVQKLLEENGFTSVATGNAETYDHVETVIAKKDTVPDEIISKLSELLSDYNVQKTNPLTTENPYDVLIIVGKKI